MRTDCGSKSQTDGAENRKACLKSVLVNSWTSSGMADERRQQSADTFRDSAVQANWSGCAVKTGIIQKCQLLVRIALAISALPYDGRAAVYTGQIRYPS